MQTTKFTIENYLAEYLRGKWGIIDKDGNHTGIVELPKDIYLYNLLHSLTIKKPLHAPVPNGNIEIVVPCCRFGNKKVERYNYISTTSARIFNKKLKLFFRADLHEFIDNAKHDEGNTYKDACYMFIEKYEIESIDPESLIKNYYRWKEKVRDNRQKKAYATR